MGTLRIVAAVIAILVIVGVIYVSSLYWQAAQHKAMCDKWYEDLKDRSNNLMTHLLHNDSLNAEIAKYNQQC